MRPALAAALLLAFPAVPAHAHSLWGVRGDGRITSERREVPPFREIRLETHADVTVKVGPARSVAVSLDGDLQRLLATRVEGGVLVVEAEEPLRPTELKVEVTTPELRALEVSGSGDASVEGGAGALELVVNGSGDIRWRGQAKVEAAVVRGSGEVSRRD